MGLRPNNKKNPFHNNIQVCCDCGDCCLIHQQFTIEQNPILQQQTTVAVYEANEYEPACTPGTSNGDPTVQQTGTVLPFGTVIASNNGINAFDFTVFAENGEDFITKTVQPGTQVAISGVTSRVTATYLPVDPIRALFQFDLFLYPPDPV